MRKRACVDRVRRIRGRIDRKHVLVRQADPDIGVEHGSVGIEPMSVAVGPGFPLHHEPGRWLRQQRAHERNRGRLGHMPAIHFEHGVFRNAGRLIAREKRRSVDGFAVGRDGKRARCVCEQRDLGQALPAESAPEVVHIEHPDVRAARTGGEQLRIIRRVLPAVGGGDERALVARPREHDVARLIADEQRAGLGHLHCEELCAPVAFACATVELRVPQGASWAALPIRRDYLSFFGGRMKVGVSRGGYKDGVSVGG